MYDYIIIGAGSAGCVLARRLSENPDTRILLLEAGARDRHPLLHVPAGFSHCIGNPSFDWCYQTEPEPGACDRRIVWPRGKVLGGSSAINGLLYVRGQAEDYDGWRQLGNPGWGWDDVLPYFLKAEDQQRGPSQFHHTGGPLTVSDILHPHPLSEEFIRAGAELGLPRDTDYNGSAQEGVGLYQLTVRKGRRQSAATAYLCEAERRQNLQVETRALAESILFDGRRAAGVQYTKQGCRREALASREVLLCGGTINSPQLLQLSGIGRGGDLKSLGIEVIQDLQGVGENLQDHYQVPIIHRVKNVGSLNELSRGLPLAGEVAKYVFRRQGLLTSSPAQAFAFARTRNELLTPDIQLHFLPASLDINRKKGGRAFNREPGMTATVCQLRPESRGAVRVRSADPNQHPAIFANYLSDPLDQATIVEGVKFTRRLFGADAFAAHRGSELLPGPLADNDEAILAYCRQVGASIYHPVGTCRMGSDDMAVVDSELKVRGVTGLRVVDASIMPRLVSGNTNAPTIMIAEKAADMIRQKQSMNTA